MILKLFKKYDCIFIFLHEFCKAVQWTYKEQIVYLFILLLKSPLFSGSYLTLILFYL